MAQGALGKLTRDQSGFNGYGDFKFSLFRVKVRGNVILIEHGYDNSQESAYLWHEEWYQNSLSCATA
jgi:hypothetical protein